MDEGEFNACITCIQAYNTQRLEYKECSDTLYFRASEQITYKKCISVDFS